jgi:cytochrome oxidase Cu insertion factor (SCO1/SenC/PrrC family)
VEVTHDSCQPPPRGEPQQRRALVTNRHLCSEAARQLRRSHRPACLVFLTVHEDADFARDRKGRDGLTTPTRAGATYEKIHNPGEDPNVYFMNHSAFTYLISPDGKWKLLYDFDKPRDTEKIVADIEQVLAGGCRRTGQVESN